MGWGPRKFSLLLLCVFVIFYNVASETNKDKAATAAPSLSDKARYTIVTHESPLKKSTRNSRTHIIRNKEGVPFICTIPNPAGSDEERSNSDEDPAPETAAPVSLDSLLQPLTGRCLVRNEGYWNYELCHRKTMRQFHAEPNGVRTEYSLGDFVSASEQSVKDGGEDMVVHNFEGGTNCDETGTGRATSIQYRCVPGDNDHLEAITEVATCQYVIRFATSAICNPGQRAAKPRPFKARDFLAPLAGSCFYRVEGWWTYEFCYGKHVRQFHQENKVTTADFLLGKFVEGENMRPEPVRPADGGDASYSQYYSQGTACDITGGLRKTEVQFVCAAEQHNVFHSIKEKASCEYVVVFYTALMCNHPAFQIQEDPLVQMDCYPADPTVYPMPSMPSID